MKLLLRKTTILITVLSFSFFSKKCLSQTNDAVRMIFSAKTFSITEEFSGDWGGYTYTYTFTKNDKIVNVIWEEEKLEKKTLKGKSKIKLEDLNTIENVFNDCVVKIKKGKNGSTEHSKYIFKDERTTYQIDDNSTMVCVEDIKVWREQIFPLDTKNK